MALLAAVDVSLPPAVADQERIQGEVAERRCLADLDPLAAEGRLKVEKANADALLARYLGDLNTKEDEIYATNKKIEGYEENIFETEGKLRFVEVGSVAQAKAAVKMLEARRTFRAR